MAAFSGYAEVVELLLAARADPDQAGLHQEMGLSTTDERVLAFGSAPAYVFGRVVEQGLPREEREISWLVQ